MTDIGIDLEPAAKIIADSISPSGHRVTTMQVTMHRFVLAEFNTHRLFSRSSASSRAIPVSTQMDRILESPAFPVAWTSEQPGMQGGPELVGHFEDDAYELFEYVKNSTLGAIATYVRSHKDPATRLHKSVLNRLLEPFMWHSVVVTSTEWNNFWFQRATEFSPLAQPELRACVDLMLEAYRSSEPARLDYGQWHLPYIDDEDWEWIYKHNSDPDRDPTDYLNLMKAKAISVSRVARISYLKPGIPREWGKDLERYDKLVSANPRHVAPLEMACTPAWPAEVAFVEGNFRGWHQHRHEIQPHVWDQA